MAVVFIFILTELTDDVGALNRRIMLDTLQIFPQRLISYFINLWEIEKNPPTAWGDPHSPQWGSGAIKAVFGKKVCGLHVTYVIYMALDGVQLL